MSMLTVEQSRRSESGARSAFRRNRVPVTGSVMPQSALAWDDAAELVRGVLSGTQLAVAIAQVAPRSYRELCAALKGLAYWGAPGLGTVAEGYAVRGLLELGTVAVHNLAAQLDDASEGEGPWSAREYPTEATRVFGTWRREVRISDLARRILVERELVEWDNSPAAGTPVMPVRARASRYQVAPGLTATADEIVSLVFGWWMVIQDPDAWRAPVITGEISGWFRDLVARLWTQYLVAGVLPENQAADRERTIRIERETLAERLESGDEFVGYGEPARMIAMRHPDVWRLRFVEYHLARAFGFYGYDARTRWARREIGRTLAPFRPVGR